MRPVTNVNKLFIYCQIFVAMAIHWAMIACQKDFSFAVVRVVAADTVLFQYGLDIAWEIKDLQKAF